MSEEPNRLWHDPMIIIYDNLITPGTRCSARAYDVEDRRWYELNINSEVDENDAWMSSTIAECIKTHYHNPHETSAAVLPPPFNVINTDLQRTQTSYEMKPIKLIARPIREKFHYAAGRLIPTTLAEKVVDKIFCRSCGGPL